MRYWASAIGEQFIFDMVALTDYPWRCRTFGAIRSAKGAASLRVAREGYLFDGLMFDELMFDVL